MFALLQLVIGLALLAILLSCLVIRIRSIRTGEKRIETLTDAVRSSEDQLRRLRTRPDPIAIGESRAGRGRAADASAQSRRWRGARPKS